MKFMKDKLGGRLKWHLIIIYIAIIIIVPLLFVTDIFETTPDGTIPQVIWLLVAVLFLIAALAMLSRVIMILDNVEENGTKLERIAEAVEKNRTELAQINQNTRLSETAKAIASREADIQSLREAVFDKLQQQDFDGSYEIINEIAASTAYKGMAQRLRTEADKYHDATDQERINQVIVNIEKLLDSFHWTKASTRIERLITAFPNSEKAKAIRQKLVDKKDDRKKMLLAAWDDAVKRQATDRSLEILKQLDMYLTPNEGLALQEAARDVFRNKLHSLGVQFSLAVSGRQWIKAVRSGEQIMRDFPNSRMANEIRERMTILRQKVDEQAG